MLSHLCLLRTEWSLSCFLFKQRASCVLPFFLSLPLLLIFLFLNHSAFFSLTCIFSLVNNFSIIISYDFSLSFVDPLFFFFNCKSPVYLLTCMPKGKFPGHFHANAVKISSCCCSTRSLWPINQWVRALAVNIGMGMFV